MIGEVILNNKGSNIDGIIKEYQVTNKGNINAGDFVKFISEIENNNTSLNISSISNSGANIAAVLLSENKVFIAHSYSSNNYLYGIVCTINDGVITAGVDTMLNKLNNSGKIAATILSENKVVVSCGGTFLYGIVCTINGVTITKGTDTQLSLYSNSGVCTSIVALSQSKVFIAHSANNDCVLCVAACTINNLEISVNFDTIISYSNNTGKRISAVKVLNSNVFIAFSDSNNKLNGIVCTIKNGELEFGAIKSLSSGYAGYTFSVTLLDRNKIFIAHKYSSSYWYLNSLICIIDGLVIEAGISTQIDKNNHNNKPISATTLLNNKVFISHGIYNDNSLRGTVCTIAKTLITVNDNKIIEDHINNCVASVYLKDIVFIAYNKSGQVCLYGIACKIKFFISKLELSSDEIFGIAKTSGTSDQIVEVYTPKLEVSV